MKNMRNSVRLLGHVGNAPKIKNFDSGKKRASFSLATQENYKNAQGEWVTDTQWHTVVAWGREAAIVEKFIDKGKEVSIEGKLVHSNYEDKNGQRKYITEIVLHDLIVLGPKTKSAS